MPLYDHTWPSKDPDMRSGRRLTISWETRPRN
jgi:hypothetical protein